MQEFGNFLAIAPGLGLIFQSQGRSKIFPIALGSEDLRCILADVSNRIYDSSTQLQNAKTELIDSVVTLVASDIGSTQPHTSPSGFTERLPSLFDQSIELVFSHTRFQAVVPRVDWQKVEREIVRKGYTLRLRPPIARGAGSFLNTSQPAKVYEVFNSTYGVVSEGKGVSDSESKRSALGEGAERILAAEKDDKLGVEIATGAMMESKGYIVPKLEVGPRDGFTMETAIDWVQAATVTGEKAVLPAELVYFDYVPKSGIQGFSLQHTTGLAAGSNDSEALVSGLFEVIERDAFWIVMRCRIKCPSIDLEDLTQNNPRIREIVVNAEESGLRLHLKDISLDWPLHIVHTLVEDKNGKLPAFSHGLGASLCIDGAAERSILESLQVRSGLQRVCETEWGAISYPTRVHKEAVYSWSDPLFQPHLDHLMSQPRMENFKESRNKVGSIKELLESLERNGNRVFWCRIGDLGGLSILRVYVENTVPPDHKLERMGSRLSGWVDKFSPSGAYCDPILI